MYGLSGLFAVPGLALLLSCLVQGKPDGERIAMGIGFLIGSLIWLSWSLYVRGHEIIFYHDGVEVVYRDRTVWAPWALFHVEGRAFVPESDSVHAGMLVPIDPKMIPHVELRRDGMTIAWGRNVQGPQWYFTGHHEVSLPGRYLVTAQDVGELLLVLGHRLGSDPPRSTPPPEAHVAPLPTLESPDPSGWIRMPVTRLQLPNHCARCHGPRDTTLPLPVRAPGDWVLGFFLVYTRAIEIPIPICESCKEYIERRQRNGGSLGLVVGAILGVGIGVGLAVWLGEGRDLFLWLGAVFGFFLGAFLGSVFGLWASQKGPVRVRHYSPSRGVVSVRFENPEIAAHMLARSKQEDRTPASVSGHDSESR
jgi:hypothetical protein